MNEQRVFHRHHKKKMRVSTKINVLLKRQRKGIPGLPQRIAQQQAPSAHLLSINFTFVEIYLNNVQSTFNDMNLPQSSILKTSTVIRASN